MHKYQLRRPSPIIVVPRQVPTPTGAPSPESPDSPDTPPGAPPSPDSPDSPSPTASSFPVPQNPTATAAPSVSSASSEAAATSQAVASAAPQASSAPPVSSSQITNVPVQQITQAPASTQIALSTNIGQTQANSEFSSKKAAPSAPSTNAPSEQTEASEGGSNVGSNLGSTLPEKQAQHQARTMSIGAEAALITFSVLGFLALIIGAIILLKRRRRRTQNSTLRHAEDAFDPSNNGSLHTPETVHIAGDGSGSHLTRSTNTESIFAEGPYQRPETVSTEGNRSRIEKPQPTPNPFADPSLNKAYDVLRGRPRSTTLTDRGSWTQNPFKDPVSDRFDPFGELQEKARQERVRYMEELRHEQEILEKERMGLGLPYDMPRKSSGITVEGVGILDRSGDTRGLRR
ncbi:hypothetical protein K505DRAFT_344833 [Melanomma pulvis-pyrius CBS 109.77]|uniref:Uncharacterized protein n=1 Tax=Melanomma pulvis-pyrius CBS 109.77 TaxID=1314802 RepID=A0A6A6XX17_9PLEO|nr:hypothetical protein K505DRAFT_344833 [Melanomma pulvis-pyrius CBS 109.77]